MNTPTPFLPSFTNYGVYKSDNYGAHTLRFELNGFRFWYSYNTLVAFHAPGYPRRVCENCWGPTTGKHINWIDGGYKKNRLSLENFEKHYKEEVSSQFNTKEVTV